jgi:hypothetical protein
MAGSSFSRPPRREFFQLPSDTLPVRSLVAGTVLCTPFGLIVQVTGLSSFVFSMRWTVLFGFAALGLGLGRSFGWAEWTGQPELLLFLLGPSMICWVFSTIIPSIILTILAICWAGVTVTWVIWAMGAIMKGSDSISRKTWLKKVILQSQKVWLLLWKVSSHAEATSVSYMTDIS